MAKYVINKGSDFGSTTVEADDYTIEGGWITFYDEDQVNVFSVPANTVGRVEREGSVS